MGIGAAVKRILLTFVNNSMNNNNITQKYSPPARYTPTKVIEMRQEYCTVYIQQYEQQHNTEILSHSMLYPHKGYREERQEYIYNWAVGQHITQLLLLPGPLKSLGVKRF